MKNRTVLWVLFSITLTMLIIITTGLIYFYPGRSVLRPILATFDSDKVTIRIIPQVPAASTRETTTGSVIIDGRRLDSPEIVPEPAEIEVSNNEDVPESSAIEAVLDDPIVEPIVETVAVENEVLSVELKDESAEVISETTAPDILTVESTDDTKEPESEPEDPIENLVTTVIDSVPLLNEIVTPEITTAVKVENSDERSLELETPKVGNIIPKPEPVELAIMEPKPEPVELAIMEPEPEPEPVELAIMEPEPEPVEPVIVLPEPEPIELAIVEPEPKVEPVEPIPEGLIEYDSEVPEIIEPLSDPIPVEVLIVDTAADSTEEPVLVDSIVEPEPEPEIEPEELYYEIPAIEPRYWTVAGTYPTVNQAELGLNLLQKSGLSGTIAVLSNQEFQLRLGPYGSVEQAIAMTNIVNDLAGFKNTAAVKITIPR